MCGTGGRQRLADVTETECIEPPSPPCTVLVCLHWRRVADCWPAPASVHSLFCSAIRRC